VLGTAATRTAPVRLGRPKELAGPPASAAAKAACAACQSQGVADASTVATSPSAGEEPPSALDAGALPRDFNEGRFRAGGFGAILVLSRARDDFHPLSR